MLKIGTHKRGSAAEGHRPFYVGVATRGRRTNFRLILDICLIIWGYIWEGTENMKITHVFNNLITFCGCIDSVVLASPEILSIHIMDPV